jgi:2,4-diaminopentanoate dehydrogenase
VVPVSERRSVLIGKTAPMTYRVVQWTTGNVGRRSVHAIANNPDVELVGCYAWSPDKVGVDAGELAGTDPLGLLATDDIEVS